MGSLASIYIKRETLKTLLDVVGKKNENGIELTISISDETNDYGQNVSAFVAQTQEQRESGKKKFYTGNGKVFWTDGNISKAIKKQTSQTSNTQEEEEDDLPF